MLYKICTRLAAGLGITSILLSLMSRVFWTLMAVTCSPFTWKERFFVAVAWIPKATVQAAIGPIALDSARLSGNSTQVDWGEQVRLCWESLPSCLLYWGNPNRFGVFRRVVFHVSCKRPGFMRRICAYENHELYSQESQSIDTMSACRDLGYMASVVNRCANKI